MALQLTRAIDSATIDPNVDNNNQSAIEGAVNALNGADLVPGSVNGNTAIAAGTVGSSVMGSSAVRSANVSYTSANSGILVPQVPGYFSALGTLLVAFEYTNTRSGTVFTWQADVIYADDGIGYSTGKNFATAPKLIGLGCECATGELESHRVSTRDETHIVIELTFDNTADEAIVLWGLLYGGPSS